MADQPQAPAVPAVQATRQAERLAPRRGETAAPDRRAEDVFYRLVAYIREFEANLDHDHELGARMVSFGTTMQFHVVDMGYWNPDIVTFDGLDEAGHRMKLIQNVSQLNVLLVAMPKREENEEPHRIGFVLEARDKAAAAAAVSGGALVNPRTLQPLADIGERAELLKTTLGMFPPGEPVPIARELYQLGEEVLRHWLLARGATPADDLSLLGLADEAAQLDGSLETASDTCCEISRLEETVVHDPDNAETGAHLVAIAALVGDLYALVAPKVTAAKRPGRTP